LTSSFCCKQKDWQLKTSLKSVNLDPTCLLASFVPLTSLSPLYQLALPHPYPHLLTPPPKTHTKPYSDASNDRIRTLNAGCCGSVMRCKKDGGPGEVRGRMRIRIYIYLFPPSFQHTYAAKSYEAQHTIYVYRHT